MSGIAHLKTTNHDASINSLAFPGTVADFVIKLALVGAAACGPRVQTALTPPIEWSSERQWMAKIKAALAEVEAAPQPAPPQRLGLAKMLRQAGWERSGDLLQLELKHALRNLDLEILNRLQQHRSAVAAVGAAVETAVTEV